MPLEIEKHSGFQIELPPCLTEQPHSPINQAHAHTDLHLVQIENFQEVGNVEIGR